MKIIKQIKFSSHGLHFIARRITALEALEIQSLFSSDRTEKEKINDMIDMLIDVIISVEGFKNENDDPINWGSISENEKKYILSYNFSVLADVFTQYMNSMNPSDEQEKK